jgi:hypothetical protein
MKKSIIFILSSLFFINGVCGLTQEPVSEKIKVDLLVQGGLKNIVYSYMTRELRDMGDVIISEENPHFKIIVIGHEHELKSGKKTGSCSIAVVILNYMFQEKAKALIANICLNLAKDANEELKKEIYQIFNEPLNLMDGSSHFENVLLSYCPKDELKISIEELIAEIDSECFEFVRESSGIFFEND